MLKTFTLKNGLKVASYSVPQMKSAFLSMNVKAGSIFDLPEKCGVAHFMEHLLVQGIPSFPNVEVFSEFIESLAGSYSASTSTDRIRFVVSAPATDLDKMLRVSGEVLFEPLFPEDSMERERNAVLEEIRRRLGQNTYKKYRFFVETRFKEGHPMRLDTGGTVETVEKITRDDLIEYWKTFFHPKNSYLVVVGGFDDSNIKRDIENHFAKYQSKDSFIGYPDFTNKDFSNRLVDIRQDDELKTTSIDLTFPTITDQQPWQKAVPQGLIGNILGRLRRSRLHILLRQRSGLVYGLGVGSAIYEKFGYYHFGTEAIPENVPVVLDITTKEFKNMIESGPTDKELEYAKNYLINSTLMQFDHPSAIAGWVEDFLIYEDKIVSPEEYVKVVQKLTPKDLVDFMKEYWDLSKLNLIIQGPLERNKENLKKFEDIVSII